MRKPYNNLLRKEDLIYQPRVGTSDGFEGGLQALNTDRNLAVQVVSAIKDIQVSEDNLRRSITEQQNKVLLLDAANKLSEINQTSFQSFAIDPENFKKESTAKSKEVFDRLPFQIREIARNNFLQQQSGYYYKALNNQREYLDKQTFEQTQLNIKNLAKDASSSIVGLFNVNKAANIQAQISLGSSIAEASQLLNAKNSYGQDVFSPLQKEKIYQDFYGTLFEGFASLKFDSLQSIEYKQSFIKDVLSGSAKITYKDPTTNSDIEIPAKLLNQDIRNSIAKNLSRQLNEYKKIQEDEEDYRIASDVQAGRKEAMPGTKAYDKAIEKDFEKQCKILGIDNISIATPEQIRGITQAISEYAINKKLIPSGLKQRLQAWQNSGNPVMFNMASDIYGFIRANNSKLAESLPSKKLAESITMYENLKAGMTVDESYASIEQIFWKTDENIRRTRQSEFNKLKKTDFDDVVPDKIANPTIATNYKYQYISIAEQEYLKGASIDVAKNVAKDILQRRYGESSINGTEEFIDLPPEKFYSKDYFLTPRDMRIRLNNYLKKYVDDVNKVIVKADEKTYTELGGENPSPTYALYYINDMGVPEIIFNDKGQQARVGSNIWRTEEDEAIAYVYYDIEKRATKRELEEGIKRKEFLDKNQLAKSAFNKSSLMFLKEE
jgi:hypothetical protein